MYEIQSFQFFNEGAIKIIDVATDVDFAVFDFRVQSSIKKVPLKSSSVQTICL